MRRVLGRDRAGAGGVKPRRQAAPRADALTGRQEAVRQGAREPKARCCVQHGRARRVIAGSRQLACKAQHAARTACEPVGEQEGTRVEQLVAAVAAEHDLGAGRCRRAQQRQRPELAPAEQRQLPPSLVLERARHEPACAYLGVHAREAERGPKQLDQLGLIRFGMLRERAGVCVHLARSASRGGRGDRGRVKPAAEQHRRGRRLRQPALDRPPDRAAKRAGALRLA